MRPRVTMVLAIVAILFGSALLVPAAYTRLSADDSSGGAGGGEQTVAAPEPTAPPPPTLAAAPVTVKFNGEFFSWALLDRESGTITGSKNLAKTNSTESMIKVWLVADYLRQLGATEPTAQRKKQASVAIRDSNDDAAQALWVAGGRTKVTQRLISICGLTDTRNSTRSGYAGWWSFTEMSPRDATRMGECIASGKAAGAKWTPWVLEEMSKVRGSTAAKDQKVKQGGGRWGIIDGLPQEITKQGPVSIKNGWTVLNYDGNWHLNCLGLNQDWVLAVMVRYPARLGLDYGADVCASVATQLVTPQPGAALKVPQPLVAS